MSNRLTALLEQHQEAAVLTLCRQAFWPQCLSPGVRYVRRSLPDRANVSCVISADGDSWVDVWSEPSSDAAHVQLVSFDSGAHPSTCKALSLLAAGMAFDNTHQPQTGHRRGCRRNKAEQLPERWWRSSATRSRSTFLRLNPETLALAILQLPQPLSPDLVRRGTAYERISDDDENTLSVVVAAEGISCSRRCEESESPACCRFRMPMLGGGESPATFTMTRVLAMGIQLDNQHYTQ